jgi:hypothetical protein
MKQRKTGHIWEKHLYEFEKNGGDFDIWPTLTEVSVVDDDDLPYFSPCPPF